MSITLMLVASFALSSTPLDVKAAESNPPELGAVSFGSDLPAALLQSKSSGKPLFLLFDEIPGCATCKGFGAGPLSHPLLVDAIETEFVPVAIHNNKGGADAEALKRFGEPAWNNPVVRFVDASGRDVIAREDGVWSTDGIAQRMASALRAAKREVPAWLSLAVQETEPSSVERVTFAMHCYWVGQAALGGLDGVVGVKPGSIEGHEVVEVSYRPSRLALADLVKKSDALDCAVKVFAASEADAKIARSVVGDRAKVASEMSKAPASEYLYHLQHSNLRFLPLTELQATRVNSDLGLGRAPSRWLTPTQTALLVRVDAKLRAKPDALAGVMRPALTAKLADYSRELSARL